MAPEPLDLAVDASLLDGTVQLTANSRRLGRLSASGEASLESGEHDLQLTGDVDAGLWLGRTLTTAVRGRWRPRTLELRLTAARLPFGDDAPGPLEVDASLRQYRYLDASVRVGDGQIFARMGADLITGRLDTLATLIDGVELSTLAPVPVSGLVRGRAAAGGVLGLAGHGGIRLRADDLRLAGWDLGPTTLTAAFGSGQAQLQARAPGVDVEATVDTAGQAHLRATLADAQLLRAHEDGVDSVSLTGRLQVEGSLREAAAAAAEAHVEALTATVGGWPLALVGAMQIDYRQRRGRWTEARLGTPIGELQLRDGWTAGDSLDVMAAIDSLVPAPIDGLTGRGQATLRVTGTRSAPEAVLQAQVDDVALDGRHLGSLTMTLALRDRLRGALELRQDTLGEGSLVVSLTAPATLFLADAASDAGDRARLRWTAQDLDASWLATYVLQDSTGMAISGSGELQLPALRGLDGVRWGELRGGMHLRQLRVERPRVRLRLREAAEAVVARGRATIEEFELPVEIHRRGTDRYDAAGSVLIGGRWTEAGGGFQVRLRDVDLPAVGQALPGRGTDLPEGTVRAQVDVTASPQWAARATMELDIDDLGTVEARLSGDDDAWTGRADWITLVEDSLSVTARAPSRGRWPAWDALEARAWSSGIDLMALLDQVPELESLSGRVRTELRGDSLGSAPTVTGHLEVEDLSLSLFDVRPGYRMPGGRVAVAAREGGGFRAELVGFVGETTRGKGRIRLDGWLDVIDTRQLDYALRLVTEGVPYNYDDVFETQQVRADLALSSQDGGSLLAGTVRLEDSLADFQLVDLTSPPVPPPPAIPNPLLEGMALDVYVDVEDLQTRSELSDVRVEGQVRAYGSFYKPRFQGELEVTEGTVILLSRPFTLSRGRIVVDRLLPTYSILDLIYDPILLDPELDLEAVARVKPQQETEEREVTLSLEGPVLAAAPRLTSPGLVDQQILGLLAFGSIEQDRFNYSGALYTAAGQLLLGRRAQQAGLDEFLLLPSGTALGTVGETSLRVGKHLAWPVPIWLRYEALANEPSLGQFEAEYGITSWLKIDATAHSKYELYGLGIGVSKDF
jgi:hypothetical protein